YDEMRELVPHLHHLPPPTSTVLVELERFSPYFRDAVRFGIRDIRAKSYHRAVFPGLTDAQLDAVAYRFDYDHDCMHDAGLIEAQRELARAVQAWRRAHRPGLLVYAERGDHLVICDDRGASRVMTLVAGPAAELFRFLASHRSFAAIAARFPGLHESFVRAQLSAWAARDYVHSTARDEHLALVPRGYERPP